MEKCNKNKWGMIKFIHLSKCLLNVYPKYVLGIEIQLFQYLNLLDIL